MNDHLRGGQARELSLTGHLREKGKKTSLVQHTHLPEISPCRCYKAVETALLPPT